MKPVASLDRCTKKITAAAVDHEEQLLAVSDEEGLISVHNIHSGGTIHQLEKIGTELTQIRFFKEGANFWFAAVGWDGKVAFIKTPIQQKNNYLVPILLKTNSHKGDVYAVD